jgi:hypothetical protein
MGQEESLPVLVIEGRGGFSTNYSKRMSALCTYYIYSRAVTQSFYTVKKVIDFPIPSRDVTNQTLANLYSQCNLCTFCKKYM